MALAVHSVPSSGLFLFPATNSPGPGNAWSSWCSFFFFLVHPGFKAFLVFYWSSWLSWFSNTLSFCLPGFFFLLLFLALPRPSNFFLWRSLVMLGLHGIAHSCLLRHLCFCLPYSPPGTPSSFCHSAIEWGLFGNIFGLQHLIYGTGTMDVVGSDLHSERSARTRDS